MRIPKPLLAATLALLAGQATGAETVDVTSTTMLQLGQQTRGGQPLQAPDLVTVAPVLEILSVSARDVANPLADDLSIVLTTWGSWDLADARWDAGASSSLTGEVMAGYVSGKLLDRRLSFRLGRAHVATGVARMIQLDGGEIVVAAPLGFGLSAYGGLPVAQRFGARTALGNWAPAGGDLAYGGRLGWSLALPGTAGRGLDVGVSANFVEDGGDPVREEIGADLRLQPSRSLVVTGFGSYSLYDERTSELAVRASWSATRKLLVEADWRFVAPDLFLSRNSILSVFSTEERTEFGGSASYDLGKGLFMGGSYRALIEPGETEAASDYLGSDAQARLEWRRSGTSAGAEILYLDALENGYVGGRAFARRKFGRIQGTADVVAHFFRESVNGEDLAVTGTLSAGIDLARGFSAVVAARAGMTPFLEQTFDVMAKLAYNASYRAREVK